MIKMVKNILYVDDNEITLASIKEEIESIGYEVKTATNGKHALKILQQKSFDLVLLDVLMPGMSGIDVLKKSRADKKLKNLKVAFLTVIDQRGIDKHIIEKLNPIAHIQKPIDFPKLKRQLNKILK